jgi:hypothetical protein
MTDRRRTPHIRVVELPAQRLVGEQNCCAKLSMNIRTLFVALLLTSATHGEVDRTITRTLSSLANIIIPHVEFSDDTTIQEAVDFLNMSLRAPDPPPPKLWKIRLEVPESSAKKRISIVGKNLNLHQILGALADEIGAEVIVTRQGFILRSPPKNDAQQAGTGPPATRPESNSEGSKKPQPEAEGRSR